MTSDEIKEVRSELPVTESYGLAFFVSEIAYQLAKLNERMDREDVKFFGGLPSEKEKNKEKTAKRSI